MNGWHRLWVFFSIVLAFLAIGIACLFVSEIRPRITESTLEYLHDKRPASVGFDPTRPCVEVDTGRVIIPPEYKSEMELASQREAFYAKIKIIGVMTLTWLSVCAILLATGHGVAWVIRGFRKL